MIEFLRTPTGRAFIEGTMPRIAKNLERIANSLEEQGDQSEKLDEEIKQISEKPTSDPKWEQLKLHLSILSLQDPNGTMLLKDVLTIMKNIENMEE